MQCREIDGGFPCLVICTLLFYTAMVMTDVSVVTDLLQDEEKRIKTFLETLGNKLKSHGVSSVIFKVKS